MSVQVYFIPNLGSLQPLLPSKTSLLEFRAVIMGVVGHERGLLRTFFEVKVGSGVMYIVRTKAIVLICCEPMFTLFYVYEQHRFDKLETH